MNNIDNVDNINPNWNSRNLTAEKRNKLLSIFGDNAKQGNYTIDRYGNKFIYNGKDCYFFQIPNYDKSSNEEKRFTQSSIIMEGISYGSMSAYYRYMLPVAPTKSENVKEIPWE